MFQVPFRNQHSAILVVRNYAAANRRLICTTNSVAAPVQSQRQEYPPNSSLKITEIRNRNPRNLEKLRIAPKPRGWYLDNEGKCFWNKVMLEITSKHVTSKVQHFYGFVPVIASTTEWCIRKHLYSTKDSAAVEAVGTVFAQRCLESGIFELYCGFTEEERTKPKVKIFLVALESGGLVLKEPDEVIRADWLHYPDKMERPWEYYEHPDTGEIVQESPIATELNKFNAVTKKPLH